jgi:uncharacterized protein YkwD
MTGKISGLVLVSLVSASACQNSDGNGGFGPGSAGEANSTGGTSQSAGGATQTVAGTSSTAGASVNGGATSASGGSAGSVAGGASTGGTAGTGGLAASGAGGVSSTDVCTRWTADRADLSEGTWSGAVASCMAGDLSADARANALRLVNLYRFLANLPAVTDDPTLDVGDQACALIMRANNMLSHTPPNTWLCWTQAGSDAAGQSNISGGLAVGSVDSYMIDDGNPTTLGHRRWVLSNSLGPIGIGGTDKASCMHTVGGTGKAGKPWMAWPAAGTIPLQALTGARGASVDTTGWSIQSDGIDLSQAMVTVMVDGAAQPVTLTQLLPNYGTKYAVDFIPQGWKTQAGKTYSISVSGVTPAIAYQVQVVDCQ